MRYIFFLILIFIDLVSGYGQQQDKWLLNKSTHFIIYYKNAPEEFIRELADRCEDYYNRIADDLGFRRFDFWLWDERAQVFIYDDLKDYQGSGEQPAWSGGFVLTKEKVIKTYPNAQGFFENLLPHELGHIIFREFVGFDNPAVPLWLDEAVASYQEKSRYSLADTVIKIAMKKKNFLDLEKLAKLNPYSITDRETVELFYLESYSTMNFLLNRFGREKFVSFCKELKEDRNLNKALEKSYSFKDIGELDRAWQDYLKNG